MRGIGNKEYCYDLSLLDMIQFHQLLDDIGAAGDKSKVIKLSTAEKDRKEGSNI